MTLPRPLGREMLVRWLMLAVLAGLEEVLWRGVVLGGLQPFVGSIPALGVSSLAFAIWHRRSLGARCAVHVVTGGAFGGAFLAGGIAAAMLAHTCLQPARRLGRPRRARPVAEPMIAAALRRVTKRFGSLAALDGVDLELRGGEVLALLGPNGAGKTTALSVLLGLRRPDEGRAELFGSDPRLPASRAIVGVTPQESSFPPTARVREIADLVGAHFAAPVATGELLDRFGLAECARRQVGGLSGGERRRLSVALAFVGRPLAVFLDEPTTGLDVESRRAVWSELRAFAASGGTILLSTHYLEEAEALASRIVLLARGRIATEGSPGHLAGAHGTLEDAFLALTSSPR